MASRKGKNIAKKKLIAKVKGVQYIPKTPRNKKQKVQVAPVKEHQPYVKSDDSPYVTGDRNKGAVPISRNHNGGKKKEYVKRLYKQKQHVPKRKYAADDPVVPATELMDRILQRKLAMLEPRSPKAA